MDSEAALNRRTVLKLTGSAAAVALVAGCGDDEPDAEEGTGNGQDTEDDEHEEDDGEEASDGDQTTGDDEDESVGD